jgi:hypothetical protein
MRGSGEVDIFFLFDHDKQGVTDDRLINFGIKKTWKCRYILVVCIL